MHAFPLPLFPLVAATSGGDGLIFGLPLGALIPLVLTWVPLLGGALALSRSSFREKLMQLKDGAISTLQSEVSSLRNQLTDAMDHNVKLTDRVGALETQIPALQAQIEAKDTEIAALRQRISNLEHQVSDVRVERDTVLHQLDLARAERDALAHQLDLARAQRDALLRLPGAAVIVSTLPTPDPAAPNDAVSAAEGAPEQTPAPAPAEARDPTIEVLLPAALIASPLVLAPVAPVAPSPLSAPKTREGS